MQNNYQEIANLVAMKCQEVLAPLYTELEELRAKYYPTMEKVEPTPTPEEDEEARLEYFTMLYVMTPEEVAERKRQLGFD